MDGIDTLDPFSGFDYAIRTFYLRGTNLVAGVRWSSECAGEAQRSACYVSGIGEVERDNICVIGTPNCTNKLKLQIRDNAGAAHEWKSIASEGVFSKSEEGRSVIRQASIRTRCEQEPPTASLGFWNFDRESDIDAHWWIDLKIPTKMIELLSGDIRTSSVKSIGIAVEWAGGLINDERARPKDRVTWGLLRREQSAEIYIGWVRAINWDYSSNSAVNQN